MPRLALTSSRVVLDDGVRDATMIIDGDRIAEVRDGIDIRGDEVALALGNDVLAPGLVDTHVHVDEPGRTDWDGFATATRAAAAKACR